MLFLKVIKKLGLLLQLKNINIKFDFKSNLRYHLLKKFLDSYIECETIIYLKNTEKRLSCVNKKTFFC